MVQWTGFSVSELTWNSVVKNDFEALILLFHFPSPGIISVLPCPVYPVLGLELRALRLLGGHPTSRATSPTPCFPL